MPNFGYRLWPADNKYMVTEYTGIGNFRIVCDLATDRYYLINKDQSLTEMKAFPPIR